MATINLSWIPGGGLTLAQRIYRIAKANGTTPEITSGFNPLNDLSASQSIASAENLESNTIYRFSVKSLCEIDAHYNTNGVVEGIVFDCLDDADVTTSYLTTGLTKRVTVNIALPNPTPIDGGAAIFEYTDISKVELSIYNAANDTVVKPAVTVTQVDGAISYMFTGLSASTTYTLRYVLIAELNGVEHRSDSNVYLDAPCTKAFTTSAL